MKHFKTTLISALLLLSLLLCAGCTSVSAGNNADPVVYTVGRSDGFSRLSANESEYPLWSYANRSYHEDPSAPAEVTVSFRGSTYTGTYQDSRVWVPNLYTSQCYKADGVKFTVKSGTKELASILFDIDFEKKATKSEEECRVVADGVAAEFLDLNEYKVKLVSTPSDENMQYSYTYYKEVEGYMSFDAMTVNVNGNGILTYVDFGMLGALKGVSSVGIDGEKAEKTAVEYAKTLFNTSEAEITDITVTDCRLVQTEDKKPALLYYVKVELTGKPDAEGLYELYGDLLQLLVTF